MNSNNTNTINYSYNMLTLYNNHDDKQSSYHRHTKHNTKHNTHICTTNHTNGCVLRDAHAGPPRQS